MKKFLVLPLILMLQMAVCNAQTTIPFNYSGAIETWEVPAGVFNITIEVIGGSGGSTRDFSGFGGNPSVLGGYGARLTGDFDVAPGEVLTILVGGEGTSLFSGGSSSGGGGTFVVNSSNSPLIVAGGGGGGFNRRDFPGGVSTLSEYPGGDASLTENGGGNCPGTNGNGATSACSSPTGGGGGGFFTNGANGTNGRGGFAFVNGGAGGVGYAPATGGNDGGFGGGGSNTNNGSNLAGGGGGYSGGSSSAGSIISGASIPTGGGGSYIDTGALNPSFALSTNRGNGVVVITLNFDPIPTVGEWGLIFLALSFLSGASIVLSRRKKEAIA